MIEFRKVSFQYKDSEQANSLHDVNFHIAKGEVVLLCGKSGCGKTTVTRLINGLIPHYHEGTLTGEVLVDGQAVSQHPICETSKKVGSVFQNPRSQFFNVDTTSEIVFGCENMGWQPEKIQPRLEHITHEFHIENLLGKNLFHLSGGEKQKIACASVTAYDPDVLVLDEPTSNLDCHSIRMLSEIIALWKRDGKTVVIAEHRLSYLKQVADRVIYMENGRVSMDVPALAFWKLPAAEIERRGLRSIEPIRFEKQVKMLEKSDNLEMREFHFSYTKGVGIDIPTLSIPQGAIVGIIGNNGAGKTTFARCLCGLEKKSRGEIHIGRTTANRRMRIRDSYLVMQDVNHQLFTESVEEEILIGMPGKENEHQAEAEQILESMDLLQFKDLHPLSLSGGQKQRVAVASAISSHKQLLFFDEPTSGLDYHHMIAVAENMEHIRTLGKTLFIITHDPELIVACCDYFVFMERGRVLWNGGWNDNNRHRLEDFFTTI